MLPFAHADRWLGLLAFALALIVAFVWIPNDIRTGVFEQVRRSLVIGDSLGPLVACCVIGLGGMILLAQSTPSAQSLSTSNVVWLVVLLGIVAVSGILMRYAGPVLADLLGEIPYRSLRDTAPWKYLGFVLGGTALVLALMAYALGRVRLVHVSVAVAATILIALLYDLPFDDLLLPPNGDV